MAEPADNIEASTPAPASGRTTAQAPPTELEQRPWVSVAIEPTPPRAADAAYLEARRAVEDRARLAAVRATGLLDSDVEEVFDRLTRLAVRLVRVPAAFISLVDENRDFYKSACGFGEPLATARELQGPTFCHYTVQASAPLVINDTAADPVYREIPTVRTLGVAAYVGIPLAIGEQVVGSFCAIDVHPREWSEDDLEVLTELAVSAQREIELRGALRQAQQAQAETERARQSAETANRSKSEFLANMSHELRTPLNAIGGYADLLLYEVHGPVTEEQKEALDRIRRSQRHLLGLIATILDFARIEAGRIAYHLEPLPVDDVIREVSALVESLVAAKQQRFGIHPPAGEGIRVQADREKLIQVLLNLLSNAVKFTDPGGAIDVGWSAAGDQVAMTVADTGKGIPPDKLEQIFEPFAQVDGGFTRTTEGVGLGLAISRDLARGMRGELTIESSLGEGSTFTLKLPAAEAARAAD